MCRVDKEEYYSFIFFFQDRNVFLNSVLFPQLSAFQIYPMFLSLLKTVCILICFCPSLIPCLLIFPHLCLVLYFCSYLFPLPYTHPALSCYYTTLVHCYSCFLAFDIEMFQKKHIILSLKIITRKSFKIPCIPKSRLWDRNSNVALIIDRSTILKADQL